LKAAFLEKTDDALIFRVLEHDDDLVVNDQALVLSKEAYGEVIWMLMRNPNELRVIQDIFNLILFVFIEQPPSPMKRFAVVPGIRQDGLLLTLDQDRCVIH
jgi:hypothetical protein